MQTTVKVKCGHPIVKFRQRTLKGIGIATAVFCALIFLYCLNLFLLAIYLRTTLGVYIDMISKNGQLYPLFVAICALLCFMVNIFVLYYVATAFGSDKNKHLNALLFTFVIVSLVTILILFVMCVLVLIHAYSSSEDFHDGIIAAMKNYPKDSLTKGKIDRMQVEYGCCGSKNYSDWYTVKWFDANLVNTAAFSGLQGETPFSCCSIKSAYPCIHHGIEVAPPAYLYAKDTNISISTEGCHKIVIQKRISTGWLLVLRILFLALLQLLVCIGLRFIQTALYENRSFDRADRSYTAWLCGCYRGKARATVKPPPVPPLPPELRH